MANQVTANPWKIDTPSDTPLTTGQFYVDHIEFVGWVDPAAQALVQDSNGNDVALLSGATSPTSFEQVRWVKGLMVPVSLNDGITPNLSDGYLLIYFK